MARASKDLSVEITGSKQEIAVVRLTRGAKRNALSDGLILALRDAFQNLPAVPDGVVRARDDEIGRAHV